MDTLLQGYVRFRERADRNAYCALCSGQAPHTLVITCSDSRIVPEDIFDARPGELFVLRNVGNLARTDDPSVAAALDYALLHLGVKNVVVLAHTDCGAVKASREPEHLDTEGLRLWLGEEHFDGSDVEQASRAAGVRQLDRIRKYPLFRNLEGEGKTSASLCFFDIGTCGLEIYLNGQWVAPGTVSAICK
ncbi:MAG TPA: carbonic anhydrase [Aminivibrio sp.]|nr:carbonic anhydrase [Aminivibrio sp.]